MYPLSSRVRRRKDRWIFGYQDEGFAGNAKHLFLWVSLNRSDLKAYWITGDRCLRDRLREAGYRSELRWSLRGMYRALRSGAYFFDHSIADVNTMLSGGAKIINLWHGVGVKPIQFNDPRCVVSTHAKYRSSFFTRMLFLDYLIDPDAVVSTSPFMRAHFADQFRLPEARCPELGYPRLDCSVDPELKAAARSFDSALDDQLMWSEYAEHYIYMPTWRDTERPFLQEAFPDLSALSRILQERGAVLYLKLHPKSADVLPEDFPNIRPWPTGLDVYPMLADFDCLISDYSSVLYDYLAVRDRGALVYTFDHQRYMTQDRALLYDFAEIVPGAWARSFEEFCGLLTDGEAIRAPGKRQQQVHDLFWSGSSRPASPAVARYVDALLAD